MHERHRIYQETIRQAVASFDSPEVRLVEVSRICRELGPGALPDGMHFSAAAHRAVGEALATEVLAYLRARSGKPGAAS
jgi:lysophospholipase L1-like esterase